MILADIILGTPQWLGAAVCLAVAAVGLLSWNYARSRGTGVWRGGCVLLKGAACLLLAACLLDPHYVGTRPRPGSNVFLVVADNSRSLQLSNPGSAQSRGTAVKEQLQTEGNWLTRLAQDFDTRRYLFESQVQPTQDFSELTFTGEASALANSLTALGERFRGQPVAGVLLLTDGNATDLAERNIDWSQLPPIYPVSVANEAPAVDVAVTQVAVSQTNFEAAPVTLVAELKSQGIAGEKIIVRVLNEQQQEVERRTLTVAEEARPLSERFLIKPETPGVSFYQVQVALEGEVDFPVDSTRSREATLANNRRLVTVDRGGGPYRVLYLSGLPNWEFKFLRRAMSKDDEVDLVGLIRIAKKEPKFNFLSRSGERSNPLFRGFDQTPSDVREQYDEPVLLRLGTQDAQELTSGFPKAPADLYRYHAVILDDIEATFFTQDQLSLLQQFVSQRGGGLLMLGGKNSFGAGSYARTPIADMLPVYLDRGAPQPSEQGFRLKLTREGWLQTWVRIRANERDEEQRLAGMPGFQTLNKIESIKPGAAVLAEVESGTGESHPALVVQPFGRGRAAALLIGDLWRWDMHRPDPQQSDLEQAWRQMVRWLVADVPQRVDAESRVLAGTGLPTRELIVRARDEQFAPLDNARITVTIKTPDQKEVALVAESRSENPGEYRALFAPRAAGGYRAKITATAPDGSEVGTREIGWSVEPETEEFRQLTGNAALLERIAKESGGEVIPLNRLDSFVSSLPNRKIPIVETWSYPLWHQGSVLALALACLIGEWGLRRWKGLP